MLCTVAHLELKASLAFQERTGKKGHGMELTKCSVPHQLSSSLAVTHTHAPQAHSHPEHIPSTTPPTSTHTHKLPHSQSCLWPVSSKAMVLGRQRQQWVQSQSVQGCAEPKSIQGGPPIAAAVVRPARGMHTHSSLPWQQECFLLEHAVAVCMCVLGLCVCMCVDMCTVGMCVFVCVLWWGGESPVCACIPLGLTEIHQFPSLTSPSPPRSPPALLGPPAACHLPSSLLPSVSSLISFCSVVQPVIPGVSESRTASSPGSGTFWHIGGPEICHFISLDHLKVKLKQAA